MFGLQDRQRWRWFLGVDQVQRTSRAICTRARNNALSQLQVNLQVDGLGVQILGLEPDGASAFGSGAAPDAGMNGAAFACSTVAPL